MNRSSMLCLLGQLMVLPRLLSLAGGGKVSWGTHLRRLSTLAKVHSLSYSVLLIECQSYNLSLRLKKMRIFPPRVEFVGVDVSTPGGTLPAQACTPWVIAKTCWYSGCVSVHWLWPILCTINSQFRALDFCTSQYYRSWLFTASWLCGHRWLRPNLTTPENLYWMIHVSSDLILPSSWSFYV